MDLGVDENRTEFKRSFKDLYVSLLSKTELGSEDIDAIIKLLK